MEDDTRPIGLRMEYESMWSLLDDVPTEEIEKEIPRLDILYSEALGRSRKARQEEYALSRKMNVLKQVLQRRRAAKLKSEFKMTDEHRTLLAMVGFGDLQQQPSFNYDYTYLAGKLGWTLPNDDVSNEQRETLEKLIEELPYALEELIQSNID